MHKATVNFIENNSFNNANTYYVAITEENDIVIKITRKQAANLMHNYVNKFFY